MLSNILLLLSSLPALFGERFHSVEWNSHSLSKADLNKQYCGRSNHTDLVFTLLSEQEVPVRYVEEENTCGEGEYLV